MRVVVAGVAEPCSKELCAQLATHGLRGVVATTLAELRTLCEGSARIDLFIIGPSLEGAMTLTAVGAVRRETERPIVAWGNENRAVELLGAGVDAFCPTSLPPSVIAAQAHALITQSRRRTTAAAPPLARVLDGLPTGIVVVDPRGAIRYANATVRALIGYSEVELAGRDIAHLDMDLEESGFDKSWEALLSAKTLEYGARFRARDGRIAMFEVTARLLPSIDCAVLILVERAATSSHPAEVQALSSEAGVAPMPVVELRLRDGKVVKANPPAQRAFGREDEAAFDGFLDPGALRALRAALAGGNRVDDLELPVRGPDGDERWVLVSAEVHLASAAPTAVLALTDITTRKRLEDELRHRDDMQHALLRALPDELWVLGPYGDVVPMPGYSEKEPRSLPAVIGPAMMSAIARAADRARTTGDVEVVEATVAVDGQERHLEARLVLCDAEATMVILRDISNRRNAEEALRNSEGRFRALFEQAPDATLLATKDDEIIDANPAAVSLLGGDRTAALHRTVSQLLEVPRGLRESATTYAASRNGAFSSIVFRPDGRRLPVEIRACWMAAPLDHLALISLRDLSERQRIEAQLNTADRLTSVGTLAAGVAHEINNPLAFILGNLSYLEEQLACGALGGTERSESLNALREAIDGTLRVRDIVSDLRTFSRANDTNNEPVDVFRVLDVALRMTGNEIRHRCQLVEQRDIVPRVRGSESRLAQVFVNLFINAIQAMPEGRPQTDNVVSVHCASHGDQVSITVEDNGVGIDAEHLDRVFDPFFTTKSVDLGTGLGLSICHGIVTSCGGTIRVESERGSGTRFIVELPISERGLSSLPPSSQPQQPTPGARLLIVDDEPIVLSTIRRILAPHYEVTAVPGASEALQAMRASQFDVVLCDLMMPGRSGAELFEEVAQEQPEMAERFLFMSGGPFTPTAVEFAEKHRTLIVDKPVRADQLRKRVAQVASNVEQLRPPEADP